MIYFTPALIEILRTNMRMSDSTWEKVIAADPLGWYEMLHDEKRNL